MLDGCHYHLLDSLLPAQSTQDWRRLEYLSAINFCTFIEDFEVAAKVLPQTPNVFFKPLFRTAVYHFFYMYDGDMRVRGPLSDSMVNLLLFWPTDTFSLKEILQPLPPHYTDYGSKTMIDIRNDLEVFYGKLSMLLAKALLNSRQDPDVFEKCIGPLQTVDLSGFIRPDSKIGDPRSHIDIMEIIEDSNELSGKKIKLHLITDIEFEVRKDALDALNEISQKKMKMKLPISFDYKRIQFKFDKKYKFLAPYSNEVTDIGETLSKNRPQFLKINNDPITDDVTTQILSKVPYLKGLSLSKVSLTILNHLISMRYLEQLDLSNVELTGCLGALNSKTYRLYYLNLRNCSLGNDDLEALIRSSHLCTLRQLDLSENSFCDPEGRICGLILFSKYLRKIEVLDLTSCNIHNWNVSVIGQLMEILRDLPNLTILTIDHNKFSSHVMMKYLTCLGKSDSLRYLSVSLPKDIYDWNDSADLKDKRTEDFINVFHKAIDMNFPSQVLHVLDIRRIHRDILKFRY
ncbi:unnamed protein product [Meganyctiphanes norvegica]|uniref:Leucine-rich repeat-containing protein 14 n=1 Tax=Meganyctiphanes norvegica TaxID=48144 RepID=A0AAV2S005_MEGNR